MRDILRQKFLGVACSMATILLPSAAFAQMVCGERVEIVKALESGHQEMKTAVGLSGSGGLVELYTASTGSWTLLLTVPGGPTCLLGAGEEWEDWKPNFDPNGQTVEYHTHEGGDV